MLKNEVTDMEETAGVQIDEDPGSPPEVGVY